MIDQKRIEKTHKTTRRNMCRLPKNEFRAAGSAAALPAAEIEKRAPGALAKRAGFCYYTIVFSL